MSRFAVALSTFIALACVAAGAASEARAQGLLGSAELAAGASVSFGERLGGGGFGFSAQFEYASVFEKTALGNWMGVEILSELGYESFDGADPHGGEYTQGPLVFDVGVGFPVTLLKLGDGGAGSTLLSFAIGAGMSVQHAYGYLRARLLFTLGPATFIELMGRWTPSEASNDWTDKTGLDVYQARASFYFDAGEDFDLRLFVDWTPADRTRVGRASDATAVASWPPETTTTFQNVVQAGVHFVF